MELITILHRLWRRRKLVAIGFALSVAAGLLVSFRVSLFPPDLQSRQHTIGVSVAHLLVDTPKSTVVDLAPIGADTLGERADLLANLMATTPVEASIASRMSIPLQRLVIVPPSTPPVVFTPLAQNTSKKGPAPATYRVEVTTDPTIPMISMTAQAPSPYAAARLANNAVAALQDYLQGVASYQDVPGQRRLVVTPLGTAIAGVATRGPRRLYAVAAALVLFAGFCAAIIIMPGIVRQWRNVEDPRQVTEDSEIAPVDAGKQRVWVTRRHIPTSGSGPLVVDTPIRHESDALYQERHAT